MKSINKGEYGHIDRYLLHNGLYTLAFAIMIAVLTVLTYVIFHTTKTVMIVIPILLVLPFAKFLSLYITHRKLHDIKKEEYKELLKTVDKKYRCQLVFDTNLATESQVYFVPVIFFYENTMYCYMPPEYELNHKTPSGKVAVKQILSRHGYDTFEFDFSNQFKDYIDKLSRLSMNEESEYDYSELKQFLLSMGI